MYSASGQFGPPRIPVAVDLDEIALRIRPVTGRPSRPAPVPTVVRNTASIAVIVQKSSGSVRPARRPDANAMQEAGQSRRSAIAAARAGHLHAEELMRVDGEAFSRAQRFLPAEDRRRPPALRLRGASSSPSRHRESCPCQAGQMSTFVSAKSRVKFLAPRRAPLWHCPPAFRGAKRWHGQCPHSARKGSMIVATTSRST